MKEIISIVLKNIVLTAIVGVILLGTLTFCLAMPDILAWMAKYIGNLMTYGLFIAGMLLLIAYCVNRAK